MLSPCLPVLIAFHVNAEMPAINLIAIPACEQKKLNFNELHSRQYVFFWRNRHADRKHVRWTRLSFKNVFRFYIYSENSDKGEVLRLNTHSTVSNSFDYITLIGRIHNWPLPICFPFHQPSVLPVEDNFSVISQHNRLSQFFVLSSA